MRLILGSQSPRRKEILSYFDLPFEQASPPFDEEAVPFNGDHINYVCGLAEGKALSLAPSYPGAIIITADTIVWKDGKLYGKPKDNEDAFQILSELAGQWHSVFTAVSLYHNGSIFSRYEETKVLFNPLTPEEIRHYYTKLHLADKAGGYAIQMAGGLIVKKIEGCYYNVMGFPINSVRELLLQVKIDLWNYLK